MIKFNDDDQGYKRWLEYNPNGYVLNTRRKPDANYLVLHTSSCSFINSDKRKNYTTRNYKKACANEVDDLRQVAVEHGRIDGSFSKHCSRCKPM